MYIYSCTARICRNSLHRYWNSDIYFFSQAQHQKPSTRDLQRHVAPHVRDWESLCIELNVDQDGRVLGDIKRCCKDDSKACCREVLLRWLRGEGEGPPTWGRMIDCLQRIGAEEAIADIEENVLKSK